MGVTTEVEAGEVFDGLPGSVGADLTHPHEAPEGLNDLHIDQVRSMEFISANKEAGLDACAQRRLQEKLGHRRSIDDDHANSRSSRMTVAAEVFSETRVRLRIRSNICARVGRAASRSISARR